MIYDRCPEIDEVTDSRCLRIRHPDSLYCASARAIWERPKDPPDPKKFRGLEDELDAKESALDAMRNENARLAGQVSALKEKLRQMAGTARRKQASG